MTVKKTLDGENINQIIDQNLAPYAQKNSDSVGRLFTENIDPERTPFQRDRDRIIHTTSFRRLKGKMQVVSPESGDHFRNRLTHTLEVSQIARDLARQLHLNEDLSETIALGHDLGHPPFGHVGERALDRCMKLRGSGFDHNQQSLRVVTIFERRYQAFQGLNLSKEVLDGLQKHETGFVGALGEAMFFPHLEMQLVDIADEIAYLAADLEDGMRAGFLSFEKLEKNEICAQALLDIKDISPDHRDSFIRRIIRNLLSQLILDTKDNLEKNKIQTLSDVQQCKEIIVMFNDEYFKKFKALKVLLMEEYYTQDSVLKMSQRGSDLICMVFDYLENHIDEIPKNFLPEQDKSQRICDYIAGMTDSFLADFAFKKVSPDLKNS